MPDYPDKYSGIDFGVPDGVRAACARGVELVEQGLGGDGLEAATVREARGLAAGEEPTIAKIEKMARFWARNERFLADDDKTSPAWVSAMLWGGRPGLTWSRSLVEQMRAADKATTARQPVAGPIMTQRAVQTARDDARWIMAFPRGRTEHSKGGWTVDDQFIGWLFEYLGDMREQGYQVPIARQHEQDGYTYGLVADWRATEAGVDLLVEFAGDYAARYDEGLMAHWSPGFYPPSADGEPVWYDPHTGKGYMVALDELSFVTVPHHTRLDTRGPHYQLAADPGTTTAPPTGGTTMDDEQYMELVGKYDSLVARVDALESSLAEMTDMTEEMEAMRERMTAIEGQPAEAKGGDATSAPTQTAAQSPELVALSREVEGLRRTNAELAVRAQLPDASDEDVKRLAGMSADDRAWAMGLLKTSRETGITGAAPPQTSKDDEIEGIIRTAKASGIERGQALLAHLRAEHGLDMVKLAARGGFGAIERVYGPTH